METRNANIDTGINPKVKNYNVLSEVKVQSFILRSSFFSWYARLRLLDRVVTLALGSGFKGGQIAQSPDRPKK